MHDAALDVTRLLGRRLKGRRPTGVDRVGLAYVEHFRARATALVRLRRRWLFFAAADSQRIFDLLLSEPGAAQPQQLWPLVRRALGMRRHLPAAGTWLINAVHSGLEHADYPPQVHRLGLRAAVFVHDLIPITHPQYCRAGEADRHRRRIDAALHHADALIVNSAATLSSLQTYARESGLGMPPCEVAPLAPAPLTAPARPTAPLALGPYFVMLGTIEPRKNHALLLQVWRELRAQCGPAAPHLVVIGQPGWLCESTLEELRRGDPARTHVIHRPSCNDAQLGAWLQHARALLFPSFAEGYGLPVLEALALGVPVIASDLPVLRETARHIPTYLDAHDAGAWRAEVLAYAGDSSLARQAQLARLRGFSAPSWAAHFARVDALMERSHARAA
jgi:glycosyltransferase involved in cell wall biosynthesis